MSDTKALARLRKKLTIENLWLYIIKIMLDEAKPLKAYDLKVRLRERFGINPPAVTVYTVIYRMNREGLLTKKTVKEEALYEPTSKGIEAFKQGVLFIEETLAKLKI
uniref:PadR family transcriptional regulator n=1 Tax=Thermosphaera aggregans TaxID=54254 RepID=A0A7C2FG68_9CREN